ncbi:maleate cis-trans isomerase family protein [Halovivax gelatinilyticus]|uniref:maleate cis-trans isomerase family protein n=1 Tax=Halovivax gelatinilyticus TaxID=2961597 RepID=UPI0020CA73B0|nr:aspartate/glutamate racemase family protein [Halovivax gelatinilyticus]
MVAHTRIGLIVPSTNTTNEVEFVDYAPSDVSIHVGRVTGGDCTVETLERMAADIERTAALLSDARVDLIAFGCTTGSLVHGAGYAEELIEVIQEASGVPAITTASAVVDALDGLGASTLSVATPYPDDINRLVSAYLEDHGFSIARLHGLGHASPVDVANRSETAVYDHAKTVADSAADCVFISCTDYPTFETIRPLERDIGRPVVTSNQATLWRALELTDVAYDDVPLGQLFDV